MKNFIYASILVSTLSACVTTAPKTAEEYSSDIRFSTGSLECPSCNKIKEYKIRNYETLGHHDKAGWVAGELSFISSNLTAGYIPGYKLGAKLTTTGWYLNKDNIEYWIIEADGNYTQLKIESRGKVMYSNITGESATWTDLIEIPTKYVKNALTNQTEIKLIAGRKTNTITSENDGYSQKNISKEVKYGAITSIPYSVIAGLNAGVLLKGGELPPEIK